MIVRRLPIETWQTILRYAISLPVFFEADPIEACGFQEFISWYEDRSVYWKVERHRNVLRRVCSGWNSYLQRYSHRFVELDDVTKGYIPESSVSNAIRIAYKPSAVFASKTLVKRLICDEKVSWSLEILSGFDRELDDLIIQSGRAPRLRNIFWTGHIEFDIIASFTPTLQVLRFSFRKSPSERHCRLSHLTTLSIMVRHLNNPDILLPPCSLPSLKHLSIQGAHDQVFLTPEILINTLETHGRNLITLVDSCGPSYRFFPDEVWSLCPKLQWLQTSFQWSPDSHISPTLRVLQLPLSSILVYEATEISAPTSALRKAGVNQIAFDRSWLSTILNSFFGSYIRFTVYLMDRGFSLRDIHGVTFQNFIVKLLHHRKKSHRTHPPYWSRKYFLVF